MEGSHLGRVCFPETAATLRTDQSFRGQEDRDHHHGVSVLTELPIDCVQHVPLDYMHLVCLRVMKKLLQQWVGGRSKVALGPAGRSALSERSESFEHFMPREFVRKPRGLDELDRWKAVEFRTFLLYTGPNALKPIAAEEVYCHFTAFHCAISLLVHKRLYYLQNGYAKSLLESVVQEFSRLYGAEQV